MLSPRKALVVLSGGQDSATCLFWAKTQYDEVHAITFNYGQRHYLELKAARDVALIAGVASHEIVNLGSGILHGCSPLTDHAAPLETYQSPEQMAAAIGDRVELTFVPMRNALFLTLAANRAVCKGIAHLVTGVCQEDNANYPDCRERFLDVQALTIREALDEPSFCIHAPLMHLSKQGTVELADNLGGYAFVALAFTHTAYSGEFPPITQDHATVLRADGFAKAELPDPLVLRANMEHPEFLLPDSRNYEDAVTNAYIRDRIRHLQREHLEGGHE